MVKVVYNSSNTGLLMSEKCLKRYLRKKKVKGEIAKPILPEDCVKLEQ